MMPLSNSPLVGISDGGILLEHTDGISERLHFNDADETFARELVQDVEPTLEEVKRLVSDGGNDAGKNKAGDFYHAGRFPLVLVEEWLRQRGLTMQDFKGQIVNDFLNDSNHSHFRVWQGRV
jgi:hypothetical protein